MNTNPVECESQSKPFPSPLLAAPLLTHTAASAATSCPEGWTRRCRQRQVSGSPVSTVAALPGCCLNSHLHGAGFILAMRAVHPVTFILPSSQSEPLLLLLMACRLKFPRIPVGLLLPFTIAGNSFLDRLSTDKLKEETEQKHLQRNPSCGNMISQVVECVAGLQREAQRKKTGRTRSVSACVSVQSSGMRRRKHLY